MSDLVLSQILEELKKQNEYFERIDWKLWVLQNIVELVARENGYQFDITQADNTQYPRESWSIDE